MQNIYHELQHVNEYYKKNLKNYKKIYCCFTKIIYNSFKNKYICFSFCCYLYIYKGTMPLPRKFCEDYVRGW